MAFTQADVDALDRAIASGAVKVKYADHEVVYRSLKEMRDVRADMAAQIAGTTRVRRRVGVMTRGL